MSTLYTRKNKNGLLKYYGNINNNGKRVRKYLGSSKETAVLALKKLEYDLLFQQDKKKEVINKLKPATISFLTSLESSGVSTLHVKSIQGKIRAFLTYCESSSLFNIADITPDIANQFIRNRTKQRVSNKYFSNFDDYVPKLTPTTLNKDIQTMKRMFNYFIDMEWTDSNPFRAVRKFKSKSKQRYHFIPEQVKLVMDNAGRFYDFYYLLLHTGLRSTDAFKLKPEHFEGKYLMVQMNKTGDFLHVPLPQHVLDVLQSRMANCTLFAPLNSDRQRRNCVKNIQRLFEPDFVRKNNINLHTFRHTYAHNMLNKGVPKEVLQTLLGHRSIKTTEIYANWVRKEELERWV